MLVVSLTIAFVVTRNNPGPVDDNPAGGVVDVPAPPAEEPVADPEAPDAHPDPAPDPDSEPGPDTTAPAIPGQDHETGADPDPSDELPAHWDQLAFTEKTELNPLNCNLETEVVDADDGSCQPRPVEPAVEVSEVELNQAFVLRARRLELEVVATGFDCQPVVDLAREGAANPSAILAAFNRYEDQSVSLSPGERLDILADFANAFEYLRNFDDHVYRDGPGDEAPTAAEIWQVMGQHKQCHLALTAKNVGADSSFSDGCGPNLDSHFAALSSGPDQTHQPLYLGPGWACTQAIVPFPTGDTTRTTIIFTVPTATQITAVTASHSQTEAAVTIIGLDSSVESS